jgi:predicted amidohydrolase
MKLLLVQPELAYDPTADNAGVVERLVLPFASSLGPDDVVLLPEHFDLRESREVYEAGISSLARKLGCHVVGGSHHEQRGSERVNSGVVADGSGRVVLTYEKLRPYAEERSRVREGGHFGELTIGGRSVLVLICADFWFSDVIHRASTLPDVILVPALSVSRKPSPAYSRALWEHLAVARAYEFGAYVGVSDWAHISVPGLSTPSGVGGLADPTTAEAMSLYRPIGAPARLYELDFAALDAFRADRTSRGFFWKQRGPRGGSP